MFLASSTLWQGMKCVILLNRSTTTKIDLKPNCVLGKSMLISTQGPQATGKGVYNP